MKERKLLKKETPCKFFSLIVLDSVVKTTTKKSIILKDFWKNKVVNLIDKGFESSSSDESGNGSDNDSDNDESHNESKILLKSLLKHLIMNLI